MLPHADREGPQRKKKKPSPRTRDRGRVGEPLAAIPELAAPARRRKGRPKLAVRFRGTNVDSVERPGRRWVPGEGSEPVSLWAKSTIVEHAVALPSNYDTSLRSCLRARLHSATSPAVQVDVCEPVWLLSACHYAQPRRAVAGEKAICS